MDKLSFKLDTFEGPLDLLLHLISKNRLDIYEVPISALVDQYLAYIRLAEEMDIDLASEFLVMASNLIYIKSRKLLPKPEEEPAEFTDPEEELRRQLIEYKIYKEATVPLDNRFKVYSERYTRQPMAIEPDQEDKKYRNSHPASFLSRAYERMLEKQRRKLPPAISSFSRYIGREIAPVSMGVQQIMSRIKKVGRTTFSVILRGVRSRSEIVAAFLALLELVAAKKVRVKEEAGGDYTLISEKSGEI